MSYPILSHMGSMLWYTVCSEFGSYFFSKSGLQLITDERIYTAHHSQEGFVTCYMTSYIMYKAVPATPEWCYISKSSGTG